MKMKPGMDGMGRKLAAYENFGLFSRYSALYSLFNTLLAPADSDITSPLSNLRQQWT